MHIGYENCFPALLLNQFLPVLPAERGYDRPHQVTQTVHRRQPHLVQRMNTCYHRNNFHRQAERLKYQGQEYHGSPGDPPAAHSKQQAEQNHSDKFPQSKIHTGGLRRKHE